MDWIEPLKFNAAMLLESFFKIRDLYKVLSNFPKVFDKIKFRLISCPKPARLNRSDGTQPREVWLLSTFQKLSFFFIPPF